MVHFGRSCRRNETPFRLKTYWNLIGKNCTGTSRLKSIDVFVYYINQMRHMKYIYKQYRHHSGMLQ